MSKTFYGLVVVMICAVTFSTLWDTFVYRRKIFERTGKEPLIHAIEQHRGEMTYLVFTTPYGEVCSVNYSLDSANFEMVKKFDK